MAVTFWLLMMSTQAWSRATGSVLNGMSQMDFFSGVSNPRNKELMRVFRDVDLVESLGTGMLRVLKVYKEENFVFMDHFIRVVIPYNRIASEKAKTGNVTGKTIILQKSDENVLENAVETSASLAEYFGVNERTVRRDLRYLQEQGIIRRVGPDKGGHWEVVNNE